MQPHRRAPPGPDVDDLSFAGQPVEYHPSLFSFEESWQLLSPSMQQWVQTRAGPAIRDPHTGVPTVYAYCRVLLDDQVPLDGATSAAYELLVFGKRGLVVSDGTTPHLVPQPGATRWRHHRFDLPIDPTAVRNDHRQGAPANTASDRPGWAGPAGGMLDLSVGSGLLPPAVAEVFGNLPLPTQRFLLEPFIRSRRETVQVRVYPAIIERGAECREVYWVGLFNAGWVGFACAERSVVQRAGRAPESWQDSDVTEALRQAPWTVAAWVAPVDHSAGAAVGGSAAGAVDMAGGSGGRGGGGGFGGGPFPGGMST